MYKGVKSPWLGINLDTGNWPDDPYAGIEQLAPHAVIVQAKTYYGGGEWYTLDLDYPRIAKILKAPASTAGCRSKWRARSRPTRGAQEPRRAAIRVCVAGQ